MKIHEYWKLIGEGYDLYALRDEVGDIQSILTGTDQQEALNDALFEMGAHSLPSGMSVEPLPLAEFYEASDHAAINVELGELRRFPSWEDAGELCEDPSLTDDLACDVRADGSVGVPSSGGVLADTPDEPLSVWDRDWFRFISGLGDG